MEFQAVAFWDLHAVEGTHVHRGVQRRPEVCLRDVQVMKSHVGDSGEDGQEHPDDDQSHNWRIDVVRVIVEPIDLGEPLGDQAERWTSSRSGFVALDVEDGFAPNQRHAFAGNGDNSPDTALLHSHDFFVPGFSELGRPWCSLSFSEGRRHNQAARRRVSGRQAYHRG